MSTEEKTVTVEEKQHTPKQAARYLAYGKRRAGKEMTAEEIKAAEEYRTERNWYEREWRKNNRERYNESQRRWKEKNREHVKALQKKWREEHPTYFNDYMKGYRIRKAYECGRERVIKSIESKEKILESQPMEVRELVEKIKQIRERRKA